MIHVLIERYIADDLLSTYDQLARQAMQRTYAAPGFVAGEPFTDSHNPHRRFLLCKWRSTQDWYQWAHSDERLELVSKIAPILVEPERVIIMNH